MGPQAFDLLSKDDPTQLLPVDQLSDRFVELLGLPSTDPEVRDIVAMLHAALCAAWETDQPEVLNDAFAFARGRFEVGCLAYVGVRELGVALLAAASSPLTTEQRDDLRDLVGRASAEPAPAPPPSQERVAPSTSAYVQHLILGDREAAIALTRRCATEGMSVAEILMDILEPAQREVGRLWARGHISIAQEHFCTAVTEFVMTDLYPGMFDGGAGERRLLAVHAPGSMHHVGLRMVTDILECHGWDTTYLGGNVEFETLAGLLAEDRADLLLVSASMPSQIASVRAMIRVIREDPLTRDVKVVVGGRPFLVAPDLVDAVGADGYASDARNAIDVCNQLMEVDHHRQR